MRIIKSNKIEKNAQAVSFTPKYDPNNYEGDLSQNQFEQKPDEQNLPVLNVEDIFDKLEDKQDEQQTEEVPPVEQQDIVPPEVEKQKEYPIFASPFQAMDWAEKNNEVVVIMYKTDSGRQIIREIEPHGSFYARTTHRTILVSFDRTIGDIRAFIMKNINNYSFAKKQFKKKFIVKR